MAAKLTEDVKSRICRHISDRHLLDASGKVIKEAVWQDLAIEISIPTAINLKNAAREALQGVVSGQAAEIQKDVLEQVKYVNPSRYVEFIDESIMDLYGRLNDPLYKGDLPSPGTIGERLRYLEMMISLIHKMMAIIGPPVLKPPGEKTDPMTRKYGANLFDHIAELEGVYRGEFMESLMPDTVKEVLVNEGIEV